MAQAPTTASELADELRKCICYFREAKTIGEQAGRGEELARKVEVSIRRIEGAEYDKARLDFLDEANARLNAKYGTTYAWRLIMNHNVNRLMINHMAVDLNDAEPNGLRSCRAAIDERMREIISARAALTGEA